MPTDSFSLKFSQAFIDQLGSQWNAFVVAAQNSPEFMSLVSNAPNGFIGLNPTGKGTVSSIAGIRFDPSPAAHFFDDAQDLVVIIGHELGHQFDGGNVNITSAKSIAQAESIGANNEAIAIVDEFLNYGDSTFNYPLSSHCEHSEAIYFILDCFVVARLAMTRSNSFTSPRLCAFAPLRLCAFAPLRETS